MENRAYQGPAPAPTRRLAIGSQEQPSESENQLPFTDEEGITYGDETPVVTPTPQFQFSQPPADPERAVQESTIEKRIGELTRALGERDARHADEMQEMRLLYESQLAAIQAANGGAQTQLPPGTNPDAPVTVKEFAQYMDRVLPYLEEKAIRNTWDVTQEEERAILQANPHFQSLPDGAQRAKFIQNAANLMRKRQASASAPAPQTQSGPAPQTRNVGKRVVPHVEASTRPRAADFQPESPTANFSAEYEKAKLIKDPKQRMAAMKRAFKGAQYAAGVSDEALAKASFSQRASE